MRSARLSYISFNAVDASVPRTRCGSNTRPVQDNGNMGVWVCVYAMCMRVAYIERLVVDTGLLRAATSAPPPTEMTERCHHFATQDFSNAEPPPRTQSARSHARTHRVVDILCAAYGMSFAASYAPVFGN